MKRAVGSSGIVLPAYRNRLRRAVKVRAAANKYAPQEATKRKECYEDRTGPRERW